MRRCLLAGLVIVVLGSSTCSNGNGDETTASSTVVPSSPTAVVSDPVDVASLTEAWPCGPAVRLSNPEQTVALEIEFIARADAEAVARLQDLTVSLPSEEWRAAIVFGDDLFANWCTDLPTEPVSRVISSEWPITEGSLHVSWAWGPSTEPWPATGRVRAVGLVAKPPGRDVFALDALTLTNECWNCAAG